MAYKKKKKIQFLPSFGDSRVFRCNEGLSARLDTISKDFCALRLYPLRPWHHPCLPSPHVMSIPEHVAGQVYSAVVNAAPIVIIITSMWTAICVVAIGARLFLQKWDRNGFYLEDGVMLAAMVCLTNFSSTSRSTFQALQSPSRSSLDEPRVLTAIFLQIFQVVCQACLLTGWHWGLELVFTDLELDYRIRINKWAWIATVPGNLSSVLARISITILHIRLFEIAQRPWLKYFLVVFSSLVTVAGLVDLVVVWVQPRPIQGLWDPRITVERWDPSIYQTSQIVMLGKFRSCIVHRSEVNRSENRFLRRIRPNPCPRPHYSNQQAPKAMGPEAHPGYLHRRASSPHHRLYTIETIHHHKISKHDHTGGLRRSGERVREQREMPGYPHGLCPDTSPQQKPPIK